jgi:hypothetical protein
VVARRSRNGTFDKPTRAAMLRLLKSDPEFSELR